MSSIASSVSDAGSESKKRKVIEDDHEMETESDLAKANPCLATRLEDLEDETHAGLDRIRTRHKFSSVLTDYVKQQFHIAKRIALELAFENARLAAKNAYLSDLVDRRLAPSYSSVVAQGAAAKGSSSRPQKGSLIPDPNSKTKPVSPSPSAGRKKKKSAKKSFVAVVSLDKKDEPRADSEVLMSVLKSTIDPVGDGIHVRSVNKSRSGRLFVETASKQDLDKLISNDALKAKGVSVTLKERRLPRMIIYDVPVVHSDLELVQLLRRQNSILTPEHVLKPIFKVGKRDNEVTHWVMEVSPECRDVLVKEGGLYLGWRRCRVKEHCALTRCYKCQDFGHIAKHCKEKDSTCGKCGEVGHTFKECTTEKQAKLNCQRAKQVMYDLSKVLVDESIDVAILQEPWSYGAEPVGVPGSFRKFRSNSGKAAIIVNNSKMDCMLLNELTDENAVCVWLRSGGFECCVVSHYCQYGGSIEDEIEYLARVVDSGFASVLLGLDANACNQLWFSKDARGRRRGEAGRRGEALAEFIIATDLSILNQPSQYFTFSGPRGQSDIDLSLARGWAGTNWSWEIRPDLCHSDHNAIIMVAEGGAPQGVRAPRPEPMYRITEHGAALVASFVKTEAEQFGLQSYGELSPSEQVQLLESWVGAGCASTLQKRLPGGARIAWWSDRLQSLKVKLGRLRRSYQASRRVAGATTESLRLAYRSKLGEYKKAITEAKNSDWHRFVQEKGSIDPWGVVYRICCGRGASSDIARISKANTPCSSWSESAETLLNEFFPEGPDSVVPLPLARNGWDSPSWEFSEVDLAFKSLKKGKAPGPDGISNITLREIWRAIPRQIKVLLDSCLQSGVFPDEWKIARIVVLYKGNGKDPSKARSYRPISLLNGMSKVLEILMVGRLNLCMSGLWCESQYGFRKGKSTEDLLIDLFGMVRTSRYTYVAALLVDFKGAFDFLRWPCILNRLKETGMNNHEFSLWQSFFCNRRVFMVNRGGDLRCWRNLQRGCPQGSIGGPILWNLALDELLRRLNDLGIPTVAYADDTTCLIQGDSRARVEAGVASVLEEIYKWSDKYGVDVSEEKTQLILLKGTYSVKSRSVKVLRGDTPKWVAYTTEAKLLGCIIGERLSFTTHVKELRERLSSRLGGLRRVLRKSWGVQDGVARTWIKGIFEAMALYGAGAWGEALRRKEMRDELIRCQRMVLSACMRVCHTVPTVAMQVLAGSPPWDLRCLMRRTKYRIRRGLALDDLDLVADDGTGMRNLLLKCDEEVMNKWQSDWDSSDKGRVTYEFAPDVRSSMNWCKWMNVGWLVGYILTGKGGLNFYQHKINRAPSPLCECGAVED
ncbi:hypothetical protein TKK_0003054 [Trichogramma kaykai]